jgi:multidrug efflux pump subunit AcrB
MKLPSLAIHNSQFTLTIALLLVLVGIVSYLNMPRSEDPQFDVAVTLVEVVYPGASPLDIETLVVKPLEQEIAEIENIKKIEAKINNGSVRITIDFLYGTDAEAAFNKVKQAVASVKPSLPQGIAKLLVLKATPSGVAIMQLALWSTPVDYKKLELKAKLLERQLESLPGVRKVNIWGYPEQIVAVDINVSKLKYYGISLNKVTQLLTATAKNITPGFVDASIKRFNVKASGGYTSISDIENTVISHDKQNILRIKDIAQVSFADNKPSYLAYLDENPAIFITVEQRPNTNIFVLTEKLNTVITKFSDQLPDNIALTSLFQQADSVNIRVNGFF